MSAGTTRRPGSGGSAEVSADSGVPTDAAAESGAATPPAATPGGPRPVRSGEVRLIPLLVSVVIGVVIWLIPAPAGLPENAWQLLAIFVATIVGIIAKAAPMGALSIVAIALCGATTVLAPGDPGESVEKALSGFGNGTIWLIVSAFFVARAVIQSGLGARMAMMFVSVFGRSTLGLAYGLGLTDLALSPFIPSNTARAGGIIYPITKSICETSGSHTEDPSTHKKLGSYLALTGYNMNLAVSVVFFTGAAPNAMGAKLAQSQGVTVTWGGWLMAAGVPALVGVVLVPLIIYWLNPPEIRHTPDAPKQAREALGKMGRVTACEWITLGVFFLMIGLWIFGGTFINSTTVALVGLAILLLTGALTWEDMKSEKSAWDTLVWFAALVMMGTQLNETGFVGWFGELVGTKLETMGLSTLVAFIALMAVYAVCHYMFASGTAHAASMFAVFLGVGLAIGLPAVPLAVFLSAIPTMMGCLTHYGNGPAPIYYGSGYVQLGTWWKVGAVIGVVQLVIWCAIGIPWWHVIGVW